MGGYSPPRHRGQVQPEKLLTSPAAQTANPPGAGARERTHGTQAQSAPSGRGQLTVFVFTTFIYFFIWLCWVSAVARGVFACSITLSCSMWDPAA